MRVYNTLTASSSWTPDTVLWGCVYMWALKKTTHNPLQCVCAGHHTHHTSECLLSLKSFCLENQRNSNVCHHLLNLQDVPHLTDVLEGFETPQGRVNDDRWILFHFNMNCSFHFHIINVAFIQLSFISSKTDRSIIPNHTITHSLSLFMKLILSGADRHGFSTIEALFKADYSWSFSW